MGRIVLLHSFILFVAITPTLCERRLFRVNSTHQEFSCGNQQAIRITTVYRNPLAYCRKDPSTCSWRKNETFTEYCSIDSLPQLIYKCNGNNNCSDLYSILDVNMCCNGNGTAMAPTCRNSKDFDIFFYCVKDLWILDLDTDKETSTESWLFIRASKKSDNLCECSVRSIPSPFFFFYYCDTSIHSRNCTSRQSSSNQQHFSLNPNKFSSLLLEKTSRVFTGGTLKVNCSCSADEQRITSTLNPLTTSNVETPITEKEKEKTGISEKEKEKTGGSIMVAFIASVVGNVFQIIVTTVLVVCLCKKRRHPVNYSSATVSAPTDNKQYANLRKNDVLYDECDNSNVPEETDNTYHNIVT